MEDEKIEIYAGMLDDRDALVAKHLAVLSRYRFLSDQYEKRLSGQDFEVPASPNEIHELYVELRQVEDSDEFLRDNMVAVSEAARRTGLSVSTVRRLANGNHPFSRKVHSKRRHGKLWYVLARDIQRLIQKGRVG
jgi:hypothetical protein